MAKRQDRRTYDFKSVGELADNRIAEAYKAQNIPIGIKTPLELGSRNNIYKMHTSMEAVIADNLRNLILIYRKKNEMNLVCYASQIYYLVFLQILF